jgi:hypothetical protein
MPSCLKWGEKKRQECSETEDQGYNECEESRDEGYNDCCDWWPCSWACDAWVWVSNIVCVVWTWVSNVVCVVWTVITTAVCVLWDIVVTVANAVYGTLESILGWLLSGFTFFIELIFSIPIIGAALRKLWNVVTHFIWALVGAGDILLGIIGIRPEKKLRICTVILRDNRGNAVSSVEYVESMLQVAADVYKRDANIRLVPLKPFQYDTGFDDAGKVDDSWVTIDDGTSDAELLDAAEPGSESSDFDWGPIGSQFELLASRLCFYGSWRRVVGYGAPVTCFIIRSMVNGTGRAIFTTDYIRAVGKLAPPPADSPRTIGHEILHLVGLGHTCVDDDSRNIMATAECNPATMNTVDHADPRLSDYQAMVLRSSKYATYF